MATATLGPLFQRCYRSTLRLCVAVVTGSMLVSQVSATAILNANQISGRVEFSNSNPAILEILNSDGGDEGFTHVNVRADSIGLSPAFNNYTIPVADSRTGSQYELTVESSETGISYKVSVKAHLDSFHDQYVFGTVESAGVFPEPAADTIVSFQQCAAMLDVKFVDGSGNPVSVAGGHIVAWQETAEGSGLFYNLQAQGSLLQGATHEYLAVHGDNSQYRVDVTMESGTDPYSNKVRSLCRTYVKAACDEIVEVVCPISGTIELGRIKGDIDMLGEEVHDARHLTRLWAHSGPLKNQRYDKVPGSGPFLLENMVPSDAETPPRNYIVRGEMGLRSGRRYEYFVTPWLDGWSNASVPVQAGLTTDLGKTFVMDPGFVGGAINLFGPPQGNYLSMLRHDADFDYDGNGLPDNLNLGSTHVQAWGTPTRAEGATFTARGGQARVGFVANYLAESASIKGDYQMVLGGLNGEVSVWNPSYLTLKFVNQSTPQEPVSYQYSHQQIDNRNVSNQTIIPGQETVVDHEYCMSEVRLSYVSLAGQFYNPTARAYGVFSGVDFKGDNADYRVSLWYANGTPIKAGEASDRGLVAMILPQGAYNITPKVTAVNPNGSTSNTELPPVIIDVGCRQVITLTTELQIDLDELLLAAEDGQLLLSGTLNSSASVLLLTYQHNGGEEVIICTDCGIDPSFSATITLQLGENTIVVAGLDALGGEASIISNVDYEPVIVEPPVTDPLKVIGCLNKTVKVQSFESGTTVNFDIGVSGGCGEPQVTCNPASGSYFGLGAGRVDCYAVDSCGGLSECTFNIDIEAEAIPESEEEPACSNTSDKPYLSQTVSRELLWPPNHKLVDVGLMTTVNDPCSDTSERMTSLLTEVWSDETEVPVKGDGSGHFAPDAKDMATQLRLRAERRGKEDGRVYLIISKAGNVDGIQGVACSAVIVPRSKGKRDLADAYAQAEEAQAHCVEHAAAPAGFSLHGVSEEMGPKK